MFNKKIILVVVAIFLIFSAIVGRGESKSEYFGGSDWGNTFWGPSLWNGWNYGSSPSKRIAPTPEDTNLNI